MTFHCLACGTESARPNAERPYPGAAAGRPQRIQFCPHCGFGQCDPMPSDGELAALYAGDYWKQAAPKPVNRAAAAVPFLLATRRWSDLRKHLPARALDLRMLDIGAGVGCLGLVAAAQMERGTYIAVEPDPTLRESLRLSWPQGTCGLALHADLSEVDGDFDIVVLSHLLEHVPSPLSLIEAALACLSPGGLLLVDVPNADWRFKPDVYPHLGFFEKTALTALLARAGLTPLSIDGWGDCGGFASPPPLSLRLASRLSAVVPALAGPLYDLVYRTGQRRTDGPWLRAVATRTHGNP